MQSSSASWLHSTFHTFYSALQGVQQGQISSFLSCTGIISRMHIALFTFPAVICSSHRRRVTIYSNFIAVFLSIAGFSLYSYAVEVGKLYIHAGEECSKTLNLYHVSCISAATTAIAWLCFLSITDIPTL